MATSPFYRPSAVGGGTPVASVAMDPRGLVPINRAQPLANDGFEPQRLMENRLGTQPVSSFSGAGAGFVPADRPGLSPTMGRPLPTTSPASTNYGHGQPAAAPTLTTQDVSRVAQQVNYGGQPVPPQGLDQRLATLDRLEQRFGNNPQVLQNIQAMRARLSGPQPLPQRQQGQIVGTPADTVRQMLQQRMARTPGLLGG